jgi:uncharacterized damage-inducible protein DinB
MQKDTVSLFAKYNKSVNAAMNGIIKTLGKSEWEKNLGGYFPSTRSLCSHLYICDFNWLKRFSKLRDFGALKTPLFNRDPYPFDETLFAEVTEYFTKREELDSAIIAFINEVEDSDLKSLLKYSDSQGTPYERNFGGLIMQSFNHDTHHRGMISVYLEMLGRENDFSSLGQAL